MQRSNEPVGEGLPGVPSGPVVATCCRLPEGTQRNRAALIPRPFRRVLEAASIASFQCTQGAAALLRHKRACYSLMVRTTLEVGRPSLAGPFTCLRIASS
jgi:hypothetical protein